jgi:hypothetical protein
MRLEYALLADKATLTHDQKLVVLGGDIDSATVREIPALVQITLVGKVVADSSDLSANHSFGLMCDTPDGKSQVIADQFPIHLSSGPESGQTRSARMLVDLAIVFSQSGLHTIRLLLDEQEVKAFPFRVQVAPPSEAR